jgi:hypothetical protein
MLASVGCFVSWPDNAVIEACVAAEFRDQKMSIAPELFPIAVCGSDIR